MLSSDAVVRNCVGAVRIREAHLAGFVLDISLLGRLCGDGLRCCTDKRSTRSGQAVTCCDLSVHKERDPSRECQQGAAACSTATRTQHPGTADDPANGRHSGFGSWSARNMAPSDSLPVYRSSWLQHRKCKVLVVCVSPWTSAEARQGVHHPIASTNSLTCRPQLSLISARHPFFLSIKSHEHFARTVRIMNTSL